MIKIDFVTNYFVLFHTVFRKQKKRMVLLAAMGFLNSLFDAISISMLIPLVTLLTSGTNSGTDTITQVLTRILGFFHIDLRFQSLLILMVSLSLAKVVGEFILGYVRVRIAAYYEYEMRVDLYRNVLAAKWPHLMHQKIGYLENVLMVDVHACTGLLNRVGVTLPAFASFMLYVAAALTLSFWVTIITMVVGLISLVALRPIHDRIKQYVVKIVQINKSVAHRINEIIQGMKTVKAMRLESNVLAKDRVIFENLRDVIMKSVFVKQISTSLIEPISMVFIFSIFAFSYNRPGFNLGNFVAIIYLIQRIFTQVRKIQGGMLAVSDAMPSVDYVIKLREEVIAHKDEDEGTLPFVLDRELTFRDVEFAYQPDNSVFSKLSFSVKKNEMVGIIGPSGAGKTTMVDLLLRLFDIQGGTILFDGVASSDIRLDDLRRNIGYVSQDMFLQNDTIEHNIKFYRDYITDEDMVTSAKAAGIYEFIQGLRNGFKTMVGERGMLLSGGQRQRIVLTRILAQNPHILILDEATSALDNESEAVVRQSLEALKGKMTVIVIAHRLSTVMHLDRLLALDHGRIIEEGTPQELLQDPQSYFSKVYQLASLDPDKDRDHIF